VAAFNQTRAGYHIPFSEYSGFAAQQQEQQQQQQQQQQLLSDKICLLYSFLQFKSPDKLSLFRILQPLKEK